MALPFVAAMGAKNMLKIGAALAVAFVIFLGYRYVVNLSAENGQLRENLGKMELALGVERGATDAAVEKVYQWKAAQEHYQAKIEKLEKIRDEANAEKRRLQSIFGRHDLAALALGKPALVERILNRGTERIQRMLTCATTPGGCEAPGPTQPGGDSPPASGSTRGPSASAMDGRDRDVPPPR